MDIIIQLGSGFCLGFVAAMSPGPDTVLVLRSVTTGGSRAGARVACGIGTALILHACVIFALVSVVRGIAGSPALKIVQIAGAAYLAYMGVMLLRPSCPVSGAGGAEKTQKVETCYFLQGLVTNLTNPKVIVFFTSIVSQFISARDMGGAAAVLLGVVSAVPIWFLLLSCSSARFLGRLSPGRRRAVDLVAGVLFLGLACFGSVAVLHT